MRAKQDLELVPAIYLLIRLSIKFYAAKALRSIRRRNVCPGSVRLTDSNHREISITKGDDCGNC